MNNRPNKSYITSYNRYNIPLPHEQLVALFHISQRINRINEIEKLLNEVINIATVCLSAERGLIILTDDAGEDLFTVPSESFGEQSMTFSTSIVKKTLEEKRIVMSSDLQSGIDLKNIKSAQELNILSFICVPLIVAGNQRPLGTLYIDQRIHTKEFTGEDALFLEAIANLAAIAISNASHIHRLTEENTQLREEVETSYGFSRVIGKSDAMRRVLNTAKRIMDDYCTVLITGESGVGKEVIAKAIHYNSKRKSNPFIPINCGALPDTLLEAELFGSVKGAFTGAVDKQGLFQAAEGGTLFLDEIQHTSEAMQIKLLRVLQDRTVRRVGGTKGVTVNTRLICATNEDLEQAVIEKRFRKDFYYRINVVTIHVPSLRDRNDDIPLLAKYFLDKYCREKNKDCRGFTRAALEALVRYDWIHNNVRELENEIERATIFARDGRMIEIGDLSRKIRGKSVSVKETLTTPDTLMNFADFEKKYILYILAQVHGNKAKAARYMGIPRSTLQGKMKKLGIE